MTADHDSRPAETTAAMIRQAMTRGFFGKCPNCGHGKMFRAFLKVADNCPVCSEPLHHQRADDFPAYIVIVLVGHIIVPLVLLVETEWAPPTWVHVTISGVSRTRFVPCAILSTMAFGVVRGANSPNQAL